MVEEIVIQEKGSGAFHAIETERAKGDAVCIITSNGFIVSEKTYFTDSPFMRAEEDKKNFFANCLMLLSEKLAEEIGLQGLIRLQNESILAAKKQERQRNAENI